jgi:hypothetical protein
MHQVCRVQAGAFQCNKFKCETALASSSTEAVFACATSSSACLWRLFPLQLLHRRIHQPAGSGQPLSARCCTVHHGTISSAFQWVLPAFSGSCQPAMQVACAAVCKSSSSTLAENMQRHMFVRKQPLACGVGCLCVLFFVVTWGGGILLAGHTRFS